MSPAYHWYEITGIPSLRVGADAEAGAPGPDPDPPTGGDYTTTRAARLAPNALTGTVTTGFVIPLVLSEPLLATTANGGQSLDNGRDIRLTVGGTPLAYERDSYDAVNGVLIGWLKIPDGVGTSGLSITINIGDADGVDQADPDNTWLGYSFAARSDGTNRAAGAGNFVFGSGVTAHSGYYQDSWDFDGAGGYATLTGVDFLQEETIGILMLVYGDPTMEGTDRGIMIQTDTGEANGAFVIRNSTTVPGAMNALVAGGWKNDAFGVWRGGSNTGLGGPATLCFNYATNFPSVLIDGTITAPVSSLSWGTGNFQTFGNELRVGRSSAETVGQSWLGHIGPLHIRSWVYGEHEALLLSRMLWRGASGETWNPIQIADSGGSFATLPTPPILVPEAPSPGDDASEPSGTYLRTVNVSDASGLTAAFAAALPGDDIVLANGTYAGNFTLAASGTEANPIRVRASNPNSVVMTGRMFLNGSRSIIRGLRWQSVAGGDSVTQVAGTFVTLHRNWWTDCSVSNGAQRGIVRLMNGANDARITYNLFTNIAQRGITTLTDSGGARRAYIARNGFNGSIPATSGYSGIAIGLGGAESAAAYQIDHQGVVEYNCLENLGGSDGNILQTKCAGWIIRQNTARNCPSARMEDRRGGWGVGFPVNQWIANTMLNARGILAFGYGGIYNSNYTDNVAGSGAWATMGPAAGTFEIDETLTQYGRADSQVWAHNNGTLILGNGSSSWPLPALNTLVDSHIGSITTPNATGTTYGASGVSPVARQVLTLADVGPLAGL